MAEKPTIKLGAEQMLSPFYLDRARLRMTHFCPSSNQPWISRGSAEDASEHFTRREINFLRLS
jgi:hypothetical protein